MGRARSLLFAGLAVALFILETLLKLLAPKWK